MLRFWSKVEKSEGCWTWTASRDPIGYGTFGFDGKVRKAHRVAYVLAFGEIPEGHHILHSCDNPPCVNPAHLRSGTRKDNMQDALKRGRHFQANQTACKRGHPLDDINTYLTPDGRRNCRTCRADAKRAYRARTRKAA